MKKTKLITDFQMVNEKVTEASYIFKMLNKVNINFSHINEKFFGLVGLFLECKGVSKPGSEKSTVISPKP